jgi:cytochrome c oxidase cbb3-type subunit 3
MRTTVTAAVLAALASVAVADATMQNPAAPPAGTPQGRGAGRGGPNFPQQQRPPGDPAVIARGRALYGVRCAACHGADLRGGDQGGPNLLRSDVVLTDDKGEKILPIVRDGRPGVSGTMPAQSLPEADVLAIAEYIHGVLGQAGRQGRPPERDTPIDLNVLVGDASAGERYFARACSGCHSAGGDLRGIAARVPDARTLQNLWVSGALPGGRGGRGDDGDNTRITVTVTMPGSAPVTGRLVRIDEFTVSLVQPDGVRRTFSRSGASPNVEVHDPLEPHRRLAVELTDTDMHNVTAYLVTLK